MVKKKTKRRNTCPRPIHISSGDDDDDQDDEDTDKVPLVIQAALNKISNTEVERAKKVCWAYLWK